MPKLDVSKIVQSYLREALEVIDAELGAGEARKNPQLVAAYLTSCAQIHAVQVAS